ncbi:permease prefix domain 1-containing protein [Arthrobacter sp. A2-55]|uniref:permease prefix domain 1-containing protein n=1 Tax=Arthrobacter sp. A2-55 TaxID=2897337 RepID=UPI0021CD8E14|nr:permease prefix domain 1-containing protein [Arthrobacter sp. A2-55]MCU6480898.1 permease prefix domain 1-containing protein [Arthrobacter sp. A2-55]
MSSAEHSNIHRYLDDAFAGLPMNAELQDLKEEIRSNMQSRVAELEGQGVAPAAAAATAIDELGDVRAIIGDSGAGTNEGSNAGSNGRTAGTVAEHLAAHAANKVRPRPGFVTGTVLLSVIALAALLLFVLVLGDHGSPAPAVLFGFALAMCAGAITAWSLQQETSQNYPLPRRRALGYGAAAAAAVVGLCLCALVAVAGTGLLVAGIFVVLGATVGFIRLGLSQTNRRKPWVRAMARDYQAQDRFTQDPVAAARFGIYTAAIWILAIAVFIWLTFTLGWGISWLALLTGLALFLVVLARMLFPAGEAERRQAKRE